VSAADGIRVPLRDQSRQAAHGPIGVHLVHEFPKKKAHPVADMAMPGSGEHTDDELSSYQFGRRPDITELAILLCGQESRHRSLPVPRVLPGNHMCEAPASLLLARMCSPRVASSPRGKASRTHDPRPQPGNEGKGVSIQEAKLLPIKQHMPQVCPRLWI